MSYYESNYYRNPGPVYGSQDLDEPVPGWGVLPNMAGGRRVGVGDVVAAPSSPGEPQYMATDIQMPSIKSDHHWPWWMWVGLAGAAGVGLAVAQNRGLLRKLGLRA